MNWNSIPFLGWMISLAGNISLSIPFYICWTWFGIGKAYFDFLPLKYQEIGFWHSVGLFIVVGILKSVLVPTVASVSQTNKVQKN